MLSFLPGTAVFAIAGLIAAAGPIIIHLLNRRRYRTIHWAAMDFLREALQRNRRMVQLRDLILLFLRTAAVLLFGLALARPYFTRSSASFDPNSPLHAVLIVDNSLSMAYRHGDGTLLDEARSKAKHFIEALPADSRISVVPLCGGQEGFSLDPYRTKEDAVEALDKIAVVDRQGSVAQAADLAQQACQLAPDIPASARRVVFLGDQQRVNWPADSLASHFLPLPEFQVVDVSAPDAENAWISDFRLEDGIADVETSATFVAAIRYEGRTPRSDVPVTLTMGNEVRTVLVNLEPQQTREVLFSDCRFDVAPEAGRTSFVPAKISLPPDRLELDNERHLAVPVVATLPVVFIDQWGADEDPSQLRYGETRKLRDLLAPVTTRGGASQEQLIEVRHHRIGEVNRDLLRDARLVIIAGDPDPEAAVPELREYVRQGGQLVIAAGSGFDPVAWSNAAWLDGAGILPAPLLAEPVGMSAEEATGDLKVFGLDYDSLAHEWFHPPDVAEEQLRGVLSDAKFFKTIQTHLDPASIQTSVASETQRLQDERKALAESYELERQWIEQERTGQLDEGERRKWNEERERRADIDPQWLAWSGERFNETAPLSALELASRFEPRVLARFDNGVPFLVERNIGRGAVLFVATGVHSSWNVLPHVKAMFVFDRILRSLLERTTPRRNLESVDQITLPVDVNDRQGQFTLARPDGSQETLSVEALGENNYGVTVRNVGQRGIYTVTAYRSASTESESETPLWVTPVAVNGPAEESQLAAVDESSLAERMGKANYRWIDRGQPIRLEGAQVWGQNLWWWLAVAVLVCLLAEMLLLAWPALRPEREPI